MESKITLQKTSCYFCREWLDDKNIKNHLLTCGQVLEKCPLNCLSYIQRKNLENHIKTCTKGENSNKKMHNGIANFQSLKDSPIIENDRVELIEENLIKLRKSLNEEIQMRHDVIGELGNLKKRNQITDEWTVKVSEVLNLLQKRIQEEKESRHLEIKDLNGVVQNLLKEFQARQYL
ncbi:CLUMA_CG006514, isoform A [Clunio marinus]|uniref:CLUMA_CG006514, isoform A n=1 Tax=Clunio marinus TaxID=568069 RepID=A0A1J1I3Z7_9DIPT|nr:CLUMA_CG006514, isoform A [Clunio marinus]